MISNKGVTYIITIFNKEKYLSKVIDSILSQHIDMPCEYIFINDGSTDGSASILQRKLWKIPNAQIIYKNNSGPSKSINIGINMAKYSYIQFVDGDDILLEDSTKKLVKAIEEFDSVAAFGKLAKYNDNQVVKDNTSSIKLTLIEDPLTSILKKEYKGISAIGATKALVRADILQEVGGSDEEVFVQDYSISLRLSQYGSFAYLDDYVAAVPEKYNQNNLSSNKKLEYETAILSLKHFAQEFELSKYQHKLVKKRIISLEWKLDKLDKKYYNFWRYLF